MGSTTQSIDVNVPLHAVYDQWTRFEEFPHFMEGMEEIRKDGPKRLFWRVNIGGIQKQWEAEITAEFPDRLIAWQSVDGTPNNGKVDFAAIDAESTLITVHMEYEPEGLVEKAGDALGFAAGRVEKDLRRFKDFIEEKSAATKELKSATAAAGVSDFPSGFSEGTRPEDPQNAGIRNKTERTSPDPAGDLEKSDEIDLAPESGGTSMARAPGSPAQDALRSRGNAKSGDEDMPQFYREKSSVLNPSHDEIAARAYELYLARGKVSGHEEEDWFEAEKQLSDERLGARRLI
jgi:hypothetical protein